VPHVAFGFGLLAQQGSPRNIECPHSAGSNDRNGRVHCRGATGYSLPGAAFAS
jgi:hypothetical protein